MRLKQFFYFQVAEATMATKTWAQSTRVWVSFLLGLNIWFNVPSGSTTTHRRGAIIRLRQQVNLLVDHQNVFCRVGHKCSPFCKQTPLSKCMTINLHLFVLQINYFILIANLFPFSPMQSNPYGLKESSGTTGDMSAWTSAGLQPTTGYYPYDPTLAAYGWVQQSYHFPPSQHV